MAALTRYVAFLRAINVGGRTVTMDRLRDSATALGLADVETFIASGNLIFRSRSASPGALEERIESALERALGYEVTTFIRRADELADVVARHPWPGDAAALSVGFLKEAPDAAAAGRVAALSSAAEALEVRGREAFWLHRVSQGKSKLTGAMLERALGGRVTFRNVTTVRKLAAKYAD